MSAEVGQLTEAEREALAHAVKSGELAEDHVWVEVTSHRARHRLSVALGGLTRSYGVWPDGQWPRGEFYMVPADKAATLSIPGVRVRKVAPRGDIFQRLGA